MQLLATFTTLFIGGIGGLVAWLVGAPVPFLTGPATLVTIAALFGVKCVVNTYIRNISFIIIGISIGSSVNPQVLDAAKLWPTTIFGMGFSLVTLIFVGKLLLQKLFNFEPNAALLASCPGHLSYVLSLSEETKSDTTRIAIIQSIRVLTLPLAIPATIALSTNYSLQISEINLAKISWVHFLLLFLISIALGFIILKIKFPAAFLLGGMISSSLGHGFDFTPGVAPAFLSIGAFMILGSLIGSRFSGVDLKKLKENIFVGTFFTVLALAISILFAYAFSILSGFRFVDVLIAFAPGGLETMVAMGSIVNADAAFVAFHHLIRLFFLSALIPFFISNYKQSQE